MAQPIISDIEYFIALVEMRPGLWQKSMDEYSDPIIKKILWNEICVEAISGWYKFEPKKKHLYRNEMQKQWKNLRTCFTRELNKQKEEKAVSSIPQNRQKYTYFNQLLFLKSSNNNMEISEDETNIFDDEEETLEDFPEVIVIDSSEDEDNNNSKQPSKHFEKGKVEETVRNLDDDKHFLLSLLPALQSLTDDEKLRAKSQFLKIIDQIKEERKKS